MPKPTTPQTNIQWNAINTAAKGNNLVSQLYAGKPMSQSPNVIAASSAVKPTTAPQTTFKTPLPGGASSLASSVGSTLSQNTPSSPLNSPLAGVFNTSAPQTAMLPGLGGGAVPKAPENANVTSHTVTDAQGNTTKQTYAPVEKATPGNTATTSEPIKLSDHTTALPTGPQSAPVNTSPTYSGIVGSLARTAYQAAPQSQQSAQTLAGPASSSPAAQDYTKQIATYGAGNLPIGQNAQDIAAKYAQNISDAEKAAGAQYAGYVTGGGGPIGLGRAGAVQNATSQYIQGQAQAEQAALAGTAQELTAQQQAANAANNAAGQEYTGLGYQQSGATGAANIAQGQQGVTQEGLGAAGGLLQPVQVPYNTQYINPATGQPIGGGAAGQLPQQAQDTVNSYAQQVKNGQMTRADAEQRLSAYGVAGTNALNSALGSDFNTNASNASAQTTATGQQIAAAVGPANQALDALQEAFNNLPAIQQTSIPILNAITQGGAMASGLGRQQASAFQGALAEARSRIDGALQGIIGVDAAAAQASALLPDNMVPSELPNKIAAAKQYLQNQLKGYQNSGQQNNTSNVAGGGGGIYSW